jgi:hypothetical protein
MLLVWTFLAIAARVEQQLPSLLAHAAEAEGEDMKN